MFNEEGLHLVPYPVQYAIPMFPATIKNKCLKDLRQRCGKSKVEMIFSESLNLINGII